MASTMIYPSGTEQPRAKATLAAKIWAVVTPYQDAIMHADSPERGQVLSQFAAAVDTLDQFVTGLHSKKIADLRDRKSEIWGRGREIEKQERRLESEMAQANMRVNELDNEVTAWRNCVNAEREKNLGTRFPSDAQLAARAQAIANAERELGAATNDLSLARGHVNALQEQRYKAHAELERILTECGQIDRELQRLTES